MFRIAALLLLAFASLSIGLACVVGGPIAPWILAAGSVLFPPALILMVCDRVRQRRRLLWSLCGLSLVLGGSAISVLAMQVPGPHSPVFLGQPVATLIITLTQTCVW